MRILLDECVPFPLGKLLGDHEIKTAQEMGWGRLKNGELIHRAEAGDFDIFLTSDQNLQYQQNLKNRRDRVACVVDQLLAGIENALRFGDIRSGEHKAGAIS